MEKRSVLGLSSKEIYIHVAVNLDKPHQWKADIALSVDFYNQWFMKFAPKAYRDTRVKTTAQVEEALTATGNLTALSSAALRENPEILPMLRMCTCPPIARDRLIGLSGVAPNLVKSMELRQQLPKRMKEPQLEEALQSITKTITVMIDVDIFPWLSSSQKQKQVDVHRAATIVADRLCGAVADPIIRNAQERRQLASIGKWLEGRGYRLLTASEGTTIEVMKPGTFAFRMNAPVTLSTGKNVNIPVDTVIMPKKSKKGALPLLIEAKSAGDFTNTNKRRKEEATKMNQLKSTYGKEVQYILFLCGYFDSGYLGYEAAEGIDWIWEHRMEDLALFGL